MRAAVALVVLSTLLAVPVFASGDHAGDSANRSAGTKTSEGPRCPRGAHEGYEARRLLGKTMKRARKVARRNDCYLRVVKRNGEYLPVTSDFVVNRINVGVRRRTVKSIHGVH